MDEEVSTDWAQLVCVTDTESEPFLIAKDKFTIGRVKGCDISHENNKLVSGTHCYIQRDNDGKVWLCDTSTNGTLLNSTIKLTKGERREIQHGDEFFIIHKKAEENVNIGYMFQDLAKLREEEEQDLSDDLDQTVEYDDGPPPADATMIDDTINQAVEESETTSRKHTAVKRRLATPDKSDDLSSKRTKSTKQADSSVGGGDAAATTASPDTTAENPNTTKNDEKASSAKGKGDEKAKEGEKVLEDNKGRKSGAEKGEGRKDTKEEEKEDGKTAKKEEKSHGEGEEGEKDDVFADTLTCIICQELLHDCISLQPCMHSFCAGCYSEWMAHSNECPSCRGKVDRINKNHIVNNLVEAYFKEHPEKRRPEADIKELDAKNKITRDMLYPKKARRNSSDYEDSDDVDDVDDEDDYPPAPVYNFGLAAPVPMGGTIFGFGTPFFGPTVNQYRAVCRQCPGQSDAAKAPGIVGSAFNAIKGMITGTPTTTTAATTATATAAATTATTTDQPGSSTSGTTTTTGATTDPNKPSTSGGGDGAANADDDEEYLRRDMKTFPTPPPHACGANQNHILCQCCLQIFPDRRADRAHNPDIPPQQCTICYRSYCHAYWGCRKADCNGCLAKFQDMNFGKKILTGLILDNAYESDVFRNYLEKKRLAVKDVLQACLAKLAEGTYSCPDQVRYNMTGETPLCFACALRNFKSMAYQYRAEIPRDQLPAEVTARPACYWGKNCRTQRNKPQHAQRFSHICEQTRT